MRQFKDNNLPFDEVCSPLEGPSNNEGEKQQKMA